MVGEHKTHRIGYWVTEKKFEKIDFTSVVRKCEKEGIEIVRLDMEKSLEEQGPFCLILHRVSDHLGRAKEGNEEATALIAKLKAYLRTHPEIVVLDPLSKVRKLCNRYKLYRLIRRKLAGEDVQVPAFIRITREEWKKPEELLRKIRRAGLVFPLIAKPILAHIHDLMLVHNEHGLRSLGPLRFPLVLQNYVAHDGVLWKIYVLGPEVEITPRPSIRNIKTKPSGVDAEAFHSHSVSKPSATSSLNNALPSNPKTPDRRKVEAIAERMRRTTDLSMIGIDLILETSTRRHLVIDINYFPGYDNIANVPTKLFKNLKAGLAKHEAHEKEREQGRRKNGQADELSTASERTITEEKPR